MVKHIVNLYYGTQPKVFAKTKLARDVEIKRKKVWANGCVARQVSCLAYGWKRERGEHARIQWHTGRTRAKKLRVASEIRPVIANVVQGAIRAAYWNVEWR